MNISEIIRQLEYIKETSGDLHIKEIQTEEGFDNVYRVIEGDSFSKTKLRFVHDSPF